MSAEEIFEYKKLQEGVGGSGPVQEYQLNELGKKGWELVHVSGNKSRNFLFKRRVLKSPDNEDYAYKNIEEYEDILGQKVNGSFRTGWAMARTTNAQLEKMNASDDSARSD